MPTGERAGKREARNAGLLYLIAILPAPFAFLYVPAKLLAHDDPAATLQNVLASQGLLRAGVLVELATAVLLVFAAAALRRLFAPVNRPRADLLLVLAALPAPIVFAGAALQLGALTAARGAGDATWTWLLLELHGRGIVMANVFWGLWLVPFGLLVLESRSIPRLLGWLLIAGGSLYVLASVAFVAAPQFASLASMGSAVVGGVSEICIIAWLIIRGIGREGAPSS